MSRQPSIAESSESPGEICRHPFVRWLKPGRTALCQMGGDDSRQLVLKRLDEDCLLEGDLHPDIRERLARIRELPHRAVATLIAVERDDRGGIWAVWEYVVGTSFQSWVCDPQRDARHAAGMMRELIIAVEAMHAQGIVHGALTEGNILIDASAQPRLLDVSPLLFSDEREDARALGLIFRQILGRRGEMSSDVGNALLKRIDADAGLHEMSASIGQATQAQDTPPRFAPALATSPLDQPRRGWGRILLLAGLAVLAGWAVYRANSNRPKSLPIAPPQAMQARQEK